VLWASEYRLDGIAVCHFNDVCVASLFDYRTGLTMEFWIWHALMDARVEVDMYFLSGFEAPYRVAYGSYAPFTYGLL
jgi:hypothetical protein